MTDANPRAVIGDNQSAAYGERVAEQLRGTYESLSKEVAMALEEARDLAPTVENDATMSVYARVIKRLRDLTGRIEAFHKAEKEPHLRGGQAVDSYFFSLWDKVARRSKTSKPGAADVLQVRLDAYNQRKLVEEQQRRRAAAAEAERVAREAREKAERESRAAEESRLAAERARKKETIESKGAIATQAEQQAAASTIDAGLAAGKAEDAYIETLAKPADIVRTRTEDAIVTMAQEPYAEVVDYDLLDREKLWPFINDDAKAKALRAWAKTTGYRVSMPGASVGKRAKSVVR